MQNKCVALNAQRTKVLHKYRLLDSVQRAREAHALIASSALAAKTAHHWIEVPIEVGVTENISFAPTMTRLLEYATNRLEAALAAFASSCSHLECIRLARDTVTFAFSISYICLRQPGFRLQAFLQHQVADAASFLSSMERPKEKITAGELQRLFFQPRGQMLELAQELLDRLRSGTSKHAGKRRTLAIAWRSHHAGNREIEFPDGLSLGAGELLV